MKFEAWLQQPVRAENCIIKRATWIREFVKNGLHPWLKSKGYTWAVSEKDLGNYIATGLYDNMGLSLIESVWDYPVPNIGYNQDDKMHFYHVVSLDEWDKLWLVWGSMEDVSDDSPRGQDRRFDIQEFIWGLIDVENSRQTRVLDEMLEDLSESDYEERSNRVDIYIQEHYEKY